MIIVFLPFLSFLLSFFARHLGKTNAVILNIGGVGLAFINALIMFKKVCLDGTTYLYQFDWIDINTLNLKFTFLFDPLTAVMSLLITFITLLVMIYSYGYLNEDPSLVKFLSYLNFFAFTMLTLVTAGNYVQLFIGWEGVGLASYFLISFWNTRNEATKGGLKAVIINRIGDLFFMFALALMWTLFKSFDFALTSHITTSMTEENVTIYFGDYSISLLTLLGVCLFIAACAKSAQLFFHTWLPDAMEGPTPVSSLLHSATMVTAGVFLIIRSSFIFAALPNISLIMTCLGVLTGIVSGLTGLTQYDLKKIIAYSTCSQLGFMIATCGLGHYNFALFHLVTHAFFKCSLFLCSGSIIHAVGDEQDLRKMGALYNYLPITCIFMGIGNLALCGFPFLGGYYSKDVLLETAFVTDILGFSVFLLLSVAAFLTSFYSFRAFYFTFFGQSNFSKGVQEKLHEAPMSMLIPMALLTILSIFSGFLFQEFFTGPSGLILFYDSISTSLSSSLFEFETELGTYKMLPTIFSLCGIIFSYLIFCTNIFYSKTLFFYILFNLFSQKFYFDHFNNIFLGLTALTFAYNIAYKLLDRGILEASHWFAKIIKSFSVAFAKISLGYIPHYIIILITGIFIYGVFHIYKLSLGLLIILFISMFFL